MPIYTQLHAFKRRQKAEQTHICKQAIICLVETRVDLYTYIYTKVYFHILMHTKIRRSLCC